MRHSGGGRSLIAGNARRLWQTFHEVLGEPTAKTLIDAHTADEFAAFFKDKVESVRASTPTYDVPHRSTPTLEKWMLVTTDEVLKLISSSLCKTCPLNPVPTWLVKDMKAMLSPFITLLFNRSLLPV